VSGQDVVARGGAVTRRPIRTLLYSTLYPSSARPQHGIFVETRLRELLASGSVDTKVMAPVPWFPSSHPRFGERARIAATPAQETRNGIDVRHPRYPLPPKVGMTVAPFLMAAASLGPIRRLIGEGWDFDLIDAHYFYPDGVAAAMIARVLGKPLTITARGTDLNLIPAYAVPRRLIRWAAGQAQACIGVCAALVDVLREWDIAEERLHVFRNGVDLRRFTPLPPRRSRAELNIDGGPVLLSVGHLIERKGHHLAIAALPSVLRQHPGAQLFIIGEGEERARLEALARALGVEQRVRLVGAVPNDRLAPWYSAADVLILASSREGWANVLLEAMACGTPVVATRIWGTPEVVADPEVGLLFENRDAHSLAAAVVALLASARNRERVRRYAEDFGWAPTTQAQIDLFGRLIAVHRARQA
jgi:glycosyltransferase involved in cell wall biosynthesis